MIVCVKCSRQMRPKQNGVDVTELARNKAEYWPYKVWEGDLLECQDCGITVVYIGDNHGQLPWKEHHQEGFDEAAFKAPYKAKEFTR